jgi:glycosyltransferase involved in cell wall biosynthesis
VTDDRIRIAYLIDSLRIGGTENQLVEIVARLDSDRFQPVVVCFRESDPAYVAGLQCEFREIRFGSFKSIRAAGAMVELVRFLRRRRIDIVQTFFIDATIFGVVGAKLAGVQRILSSRRDLAFWSSRRTRRAFRLVNRWVDRFWANSEAVARHLEQTERISRERIDVIYNGIDLQAFGGGPSPVGLVEPVVGIVANLNREVKRVDLFVRAAALVTDDFPSARFQIVGDGHLRPGLEALARELDLGDRLEFLGRRSDVAHIARRFSVGVICSDSEGFSNSIIEYFAMGIPVVATSVGGNPEIVADGVDGRLVRPDDHRALAAGLAGLLKNEPLRLEMGARGKKKIAASFAWPSRIGEIEAYYQSLM